MQRASMFFSIKIGQEYKPHVDYFFSAMDAQENNRLSSLVMYLNDDVEKKEEKQFFSSFKVFCFSTKKGMAVYFEYFYNDSSLNELTLHGGAPVIKGEKVGCYAMDEKTTNKVKKNSSTGEPLGEDRGVVALILYS
ncbi:hypothetical protein GCM10020331_053920 [Ectobacillus funiculus]